MNLGVSTGDPALDTRKYWSESLARTDINNIKIDQASNDSAFTSAGISDLSLYENILKRYLIYRPASFQGPFFSPFNFIFSNQIIFDLLEHSAYWNKQIQLYKVDCDNSTMPDDQSIDLSEEIDRLLSLADEIEFEDGMESKFSRKLISLIIEHSNDLIEVLAPILINEKANAEIVSEALRWIGRVEHLETKSMRLWLLERCLFSSSPSIRDGATLGLASLNDSSARYFLKKAIGKELIKELRQDMLEVLSEMETWENASLFEKN